MYVEADTGFVPVESIVKKNKISRYGLLKQRLIYMNADKHIFL